MSEFQNKIGGGLNKIQGSIQQGKQKLQVAQEISQIQQTVNTLRQKRQELIVQLGSKMYKKLRLNEMNDSDFQGITIDIEAIDKEIYKQSITMEELRSSSQEAYMCASCGTEVKPSDKFCGSCGTPVVIPEKVEESTTPCHSCEENIPSSAVYCPCCGHATAAL